MFNKNYLQKYSILDMGNNTHKYKINSETKRIKSMYIKYLEDKFCS